jgi:hypothetical protein
MAHEYIIANTQVGTFISVATAFDYVDAMKAEFVKRGQEKLKTTLTAHLELHPNLNPNLSETVKESLGEIP